MFLSRPTEYSAHVIKLCLQGLPSSPPTPRIFPPFKRPYKVSVYLASHESTEIHLRLPSESWY